MNNPLSTAEFFIHLKQFDKAKIVLDLLKPYANDLSSIDQLGKLYADIREFNDTLELTHKIYSMIDTTEGKFDARVNIIRAYLNLNMPKEALVYININEKQNPNDHPNQMDKAMAYFLLDDKVQGEQILRRILTEPHTDDVDFRVNFNLGTYDLRNGKFKEGLRHVLLDGRKLNIWHEVFSQWHSDFYYSVPQLLGPGDHKEALMRSAGDGMQLYKALIMQKDQEVKELKKQLAELKSKNS